ncbi:molybdopterin molybdenumtransferase MoeA [Saccharolobus solfataricus]|nr:molybdopterin molybdotransferase MoeA [Saccharolobus solfataricus]AKA72614.1 molybdopterin molybdenumtransferase MoeA [Saccharolobus solfataricus]AKA75313.1 molybdopterin molybdenumtransferase MoeA [Saccharolobus solfataricus]AKA78006.1 molybdopterin molybdenumtransferase MoeA [Saccharolobus solfataricus]AZF67125.1 molybdopterin molybdenumtransferase MoeA [Saccharolobus solfataricus]AZF69745.1 molybdopterin molybdenumtransferase MoeA [Saccharolobus solfataricus]
MRVFVKDELLYSIEEAIRVYLSSLNFIPKTVEVEVKDSFGYVSAEDLNSPIDYPPFSRSNVDGYALKSSCTPGELKVIDRIEIGEFKEVHINECVAVEVDTGAIIPMGADAVIKVEDVKIISGNLIKVDKKMTFGQNIGWIGSDIPKNSIILRKGEVISHEKIGLLASLGISKVKVYEKLKVYLIATGDELVEPGNSLSPGKIYESNLHYLYSKLKQNYQIVGLSLLRDDIESIKNEIKRAISLADVLILTGGTSAGEKDFVHRAIKELGSIIVHGIKIKPGKPTILGVVDNKPVIGLPGNIVSSVVVFDTVISEILRNLYPSRKEIVELGKIKAKLALGTKADKYRNTLIPVYLFKSVDSSYYALPVKFESYMIGTFSLTEGYIMLNPNEEIEEGKEVEVNVKKFDDSISIIGEEDKRILNSDTKNVLLGSLPAKKAIEYKFGDVAVISSLYSSSVDNYDRVFCRQILVNGEGEEIGYDDWIGMSKIVKNPVVKLRSPSTIYSLLGKAKVYAPEGYIIGKKVFEECLYMIGISERGKRYLSTIKV